MIELSSLIDFEVIVLCENKKGSVSDVPFRIAQVLSVAVAMVVPSLRV